VTITVKPAEGDAVSRRPAEFTIRGGRVLLESGELANTDIAIAGRSIAAIGPLARGKAIDAAGMLVLPGIVDLHGDAFERQIMPRPGVHFPIELALRETDRQLIANGITTAFHGLTWSWEPGLRGRESAMIFFAAMRKMRSRLEADTRTHLRHEVYNLEAAETILALIAADEIGLLAFNDHLPSLRRKRAQSQKLAQYAERAQLSIDAYAALLDEVAGRGASIVATNARLAAAARERGIPLASHDDDSPEVRRAYHALGCGLCEFPLNRPTLEAAHALGDAIVMGAPNVVRGGSHTGGLCVADLVREGLVDVLTSDYYYPSLVHAAFQLVAENFCDFATAWRLVSTTPARRVGLADRGAIAADQRADLLLVDDRDPTQPHVVATIVAGRIARATGDLLA